MRFFSCGSSFYTDPDTRGQIQKLKVPKLCLVKGHEAKVEAREETGEAEEDTQEDDAQPGG